MLPYIAIEAWFIWVPMKVKCAHNQGKTYHGDTIVHSPHVLDLLGYSKWATFLIRKIKHFTPLVVLSMVRDNVEIVL